MKTPGLPDVESAGTVLFDWITKFGLATVFATILLAYVLWSSITLSSAIMPTLERLTAAEERMVTTEADMAAILRQIQLSEAVNCQK